MASEIQLMVLGAHAATGSQKEAFREVARCTGLTREEVERAWRRAMRDDERDEARPSANGRRPTAGTTKETTHEDRL